MHYPPNDGASAAAHLRPTLILAENTSSHFQIRIRRLGGQLQARVGQTLRFFYFSHFQWRDNPNERIFIILKSRGRAPTRSCLDIRDSFASNPRFRP